MYLLSVPVHYLDTEIRSVGVRYQYVVDQWLEVVIRGGLQHDSSGWIHVRRKGNLSPDHMLAACLSHYQLHDDLDLQHILY